MNIVSRRCRILSFLKKIPSRKAPVFYLLVMRLVQIDSVDMKFANHGTQELRARSGDLSGLLTGQAGVFAAAFTWQTELASRGLRVNNIDCAMRFNAFALADEAMARGLQPEGLLHEIRVRRAFTPYQTLDALHEILEREAARREFHFFLAPCKQFFDGDVNQDEGAFLLNKLFSLIASMRAESIPMIFVERTAHSNPRYEAAVRRLRRDMDTVWELRADNEIKTLRRERVNNRPLAGASPDRGMARNRRVEQWSGYNGQNPASVFHATGADGGALQPLQKSSA